MYENTYIYFVIRSILSNLAMLSVSTDISLVRALGPVSI